MRVTIRLYKRHDLDLYALYMASGNKYDFKEVMKKTLKAYINNQPIKNELPDLEGIKIADLPPKTNFHINVTAEDTDIQEWLQTIRLGRRNNLMKNILRNSYPPIIAPYYNESEHNSFNFRKGYDKK